MYTLFCVEVSTLALKVKTAVSRAFKVLIDQIPLVAL